MKFELFAMWKQQLLTISTLGWMLGCFACGGNEKQTSQDLATGAESTEGETSDTATESTTQEETDTMTPLAECGNKKIESDEECDDGGNNGSYGFCKMDCSGIGPRCGDGNKDEGYEQCDDGNLNDVDACKNTCIRTIQQVSAGGDHTCALLNSGNVRCWGNGSFGQLGYGNTDNIGDNETPASAGDIDVNKIGITTQIATGGAHTCALLEGELQCWGLGDSGQLGFASTSNIGDNETPAAGIMYVAVGGSMIQITSGGTHTCALLNGGKVRCWGNGLFGQLGYGNINNIGDNEHPISAGDVPVGGTVAQLAAGENHTCALLNNGEVRCWGYGLHGQLGYGNSDDIGDNEHPISAGVVPVDGTVVQLAAGADHTCALLNNGEVRCWGLNKAGQLGYGHTNNIGDGPGEMPPADVDVGGTVAQITARGDHTCALLDNGKVRCWGRGSSGQLGYGNTNNIGDGLGEMPPADVDVGGTVAQITTGWHHTCAILDSGNLSCWGRGSFGRLGYGNEDDIGDDETPDSLGTFVTVF